MDFVHSEPTGPRTPAVQGSGDKVPDDLPQAVKILIAGGFGAGKTTLVAAVSEITPFHTEETLTSSGLGVDDIAGAEHKSTTTVAMDFERRGLPFVVAVNSFEDARAYPADTVRAALDLAPGVPVLLCDARHHHSVKQVLIATVEHVLALESR